MSFAALNLIEQLALPPTGSNFYDSPLGKIYFFYCVLYTVCFVLLQNVKWDLKIVSKKILMLST